MSSTSPSRRRDRLRDVLHEKQVDALLVSSETNVSYLTGFSGDSSALLLTRSRDLIVSDGRYTLQLQQECPDVEPHIRPVGQPLMAGVAEVAGQLGLHRLAFESAALSVATYEDLRGRSQSLDLLGTSGAVETLRAVKDSEEIADIRQAISFAERAFSMFRSGLRSDESEKTAADHLESYLRRCGASAASFPPIVAVGPHAAFPHYRPSDTTKIGDAPFVLVDWGAAGRSYRSDLTRVLVTGKVSSEFERIYQVVLAAQEQAIAALRPGRKASEIDRVARSFIEDAGFGPQFQHGLGHGLGRDIHETPWFRKDSDTVLQAGMIVTIEPGIYLPDRGGVRIEDDVLITSDGCEVLSHLPRSLESARLP